MPRPRILAPVLAALLGPLTACPQATQPAPDAQPGDAPPSIDDKRVVADTADYYAADHVPSQTPAAVASATPAAPGSGRPDESNGKCRLYAPELPDPQCCERQLGFDVEVVKRACGLKLYLGESYHATCGYHFLPEVTTTGTPATWFRLSTVRGATAREAAEAHDTYTRKISRDPSFTSVPIPGITGAYWSAQDDLHWAFLPGWSVVRQFTWQTGSCSDEGIRQILEHLITTPEIPAGAVRRGLIPGAAPAPAPAPTDTPSPAPAPASAAG